VWTAGSTAQEVLVEVRTAWHGGVGGAAAIGGRVALGGVGSSGLGMTRVVGKLEEKEKCHLVFFF
jgi:hypothetical protein